MLKSLSINPDFNLSKKVLGAPSSPYTFFSKNKARSNLYFPLKYFCGFIDISSFNFACGNVPGKPFQCLHYFHPQCVTNWKTWGLTIGKCFGPRNACFYCESKMCITYNDLYDHVWYLDGTVTKSNSNERSRIDLDSNVTASTSSVIVPNNPYPNPNHI